MEPRIVTRTHYQVDEPAYISLLVNRCTSPVRSDYPERVAKRLSAELKNVGIGLNEAAGKYAIDLARALGVLTDNLVWTAKGHLIHVVTGTLPFSLELPLSHRILYFRIFFDADGAAILFLGKSVVKTGRLPPPDSNWNAIATQLIGDIYTDYLKFMVNPQSRTRLRQAITRHSHHPYQGKSGPHQLFVHLQSMFRIGLLTREEEGAARIYRHKGATTGETPLEKFLSRVTDVRDIEQAVSARNWSHIAEEVFRGTESNPSDPATDDDWESRLRVLYEEVLRTGVTQCPLETLLPALQISQLASGRQPSSWDDWISKLRDMQKKNPGGVRFHVDRYGRPAFLRLSV